MVTIEEGKYYLNMINEVIGPMRKNDDDQYKWVSTNRDGTESTFTDTGSFLVPTNMWQDLKQQCIKLHDEIAVTSILEEDKIYQTFNGMIVGPLKPIIPKVTHFAWKAHIISTGKSNTGKIPTTELVFTDKGKYVANPTSIVPHDFDLVGLVELEYRVISELVFPIEIKPTRWAVLLSATDDVTITEPMTRQEAEMKYTRVLGPIKEK